MTTAFDQKTVFVLGAGFTKAFLPQAPLVEDDYGGEVLLTQLQGEESKNARTILELELKTCGGGKINIERLMTRLEGGMPYDLNHRADKELQWFLSVIKRRFVERIQEALKAGVGHLDELQLFAKACLGKGMNCITFNYDDVLDKALFEEGPPYQSPTWNPDRGYGFPCLISQACLIPPRKFEGECSMLLLKLHGSVNWRIPFGFPRPYGLDAIRHHEEWFGHRGAAYKLDLKEIDPLLEQDSLIIPPVLTKTGLAEQPVLRFLWTRAFETLSKADQVVFIGYSMPITDLSSGYLFREGLGHLEKSDQVNVVDFAANDQERKERLQTLLPSYRKIFPKISPAQFDFSGAKSWVFNNLTLWLYDSKGEPIAFLFGRHVISRSGRFIGTITSAFPLVHGPSVDGQSTYAGQIEDDRLVFKTVQEGSQRQIQISAPKFPGVPKIPRPIGAKSLPEGYRDLANDELE
jgi:hypothetical protein